MDGREARSAHSAPFAQTHSSSSSGAPSHAALSSSAKSPGSPPPPPPIAEHLMSRNAVENNSKLFPMFKQNLTDPTQYLITVQKLLGWMSRDKAYYPNARPWIVEFVETAKHTVAVLGGGDFVQSFDHVTKCRDSLYLRPYMDLVAVLASFRHLYDEPDLIARIDALKSTISGIPPQASYAGPSFSAPPTSGLPPRPTRSAMPMPPPIVTGPYAGPVSPMTPTYPTGTPVYAQPPRLGVNIPAGFSAPAPVFGGAASSPLFRTPAAPFPPVAGANQAQPGSSASFRGTPPVAAAHPAKVAGWSTAPPPPQNIQPTASISAPQAGPSASTPMSMQASRPSSRGGTGSGSASSTPGPSMAGAPQQKKEKKKKKAAAPLTFLEADLDWFLQQQKRQLPQKEETHGKVDEEAGPVAQEVAVDAGGQGDAHQVAEAVPDAQEQAQEEGAQPRPESAGIGGRHDEASKTAENDGRVISPATQDSVISAPQQTHEVSPPEVSRSISAEDPVKDDVEKPTDQVSVDATYVAAPSHNANAEPQLEEPAESNELTTAASAVAADQVSGTDNDTAHVAQAGVDGPAPVTTSHEQMELQNPAQLDEEVGAALARDVTSITPPPVTSGSTPLPTSDTSVQQPEQWPSTQPPTSVAQAAPAPALQPAPVPAAQASPFTSTASLPPRTSTSSPAIPPAAPSSGSPTLSTRLSPSAASPRLYSSTKSPFDNMAREQWAHRRTVPELKIQPVPASMVRLSASPVVRASSAAAHGSPPPAPMSGTEPTTAPLSPALSKATIPETAGQTHSAGATGHSGLGSPSPVIKAMPEIRSNNQVHLTEPPKMAPFYAVSVVEPATKQDDSSRSKDPVCEPVPMDVDDTHGSDDKPPDSDVDASTSSIQQTPISEAITQDTEFSPKDAASEATESAILPTAAEDVQMSEPAQAEVPANSTVDDKAEDAMNASEDQDMDLGSDDSAEPADKVAESADVSMEISDTASIAPAPEVGAPTSSQDLNLQTQVQSSTSVPTQDNPEDGEQAQTQPGDIPPAHADTDSQTSSTTTDGPIIKTRDYAIQSFADGDFVYPHKSNPENSETVQEPSKAVAEPEHREPAPVTSATPDDAAALSTSVDTALMRLTSAVSTAAPGQEEIPLTWEVKVAYARGIPITNPPPPPDYDAVHFAEPMQVIGSSRGGNSWREHITWEFEVNTELKAALQRWTDRHKPTDSDVSSAKCLSASCYKYSRSLEKPNVLILRPNVWDWNMFPWLEIDNGEGIQKICIYNCTVSEDQLLDISGRVRLGKNTIKLNYPYGTPSDWVFVLRVHDPTAPQLAEMNARRQSELRWQKTLDDLVNFKKPSLKWPADIVPIRPRDRSRAQSQTRLEGENKPE